MLEWIAAMQFHPLRHNLRQYAFLFAPRPRLLLSDVNSFVSFVSTLAAGSGAARGCASCDRLPRGLSFHRVVMSNSVTVARKTEDHLKYVYCIQSVHSIDT